MVGVKTIENQDQLEAAFKEYGQDHILLLNFYASWVEPCKHMNEVFEELAKKYTKLVYLQIEAEKLLDASEEYQVEAVPTFVFVKKGKVIHRVDGANAIELTAAAEKYSQVSIQKEASSTTPTVPLETRLKQLIKAHPVMLFMKGNPQTPRCGFSRQVIELFNELNVKYGSFDILGDEQVRQGLKTFSDWPTYPQIYVQGELIGGLDILKEMVASGEFQKMLPQQEDLNERLKKLQVTLVAIILMNRINKAPVVLFMKGSPLTPKCGFSNQIVQLLNDQGIKYDSFDILEDDEVRQGLKVFSDWPTYPQVYVKGELIGGLDIVREMIANGDKII